ncbi:MAG TPA: hypothetical protein VGA21_10715 [Cyclobacteriaceae bacterium]|jgi:hypothetical protein
MHQFFKRRAVSFSASAWFVVATLIFTAYIYYNNLTSLPAQIFFGILIIITFLLFVLQRVVVVDLDQITLRKSLLLFSVGIGIAAPVPLHHIKEVFINKVKFSQKRTAPTHSSQTLTSQGFEFKAFLLLKDGSTYLLDSSPNHEEILDELISLAEVLNIELVDNSG